TRRSSPPSPNLFDFDGKPPEVGPAILLLGDRFPERVIQPLDPVAEQILKPDKQGELQTAIAGFANHSHHVDTHALLAKRRNGDVAGVIDREISHAPAIDVVSRYGIP